MKLKHKKKYFTWGITGALLHAGFTITARTYVGHEDDTGYHHYAIDIAQSYETEE